MQFSVLVVRVSCKVTLDTKTFALQRIRLMISIKHSVVVTDK